MTQTTLSVPDISCGHCKTSIEGAVKPLDGVDTAEVSIDDRNVDVTYDPSKINLSDIIVAISDQGYEVDDA
jgi:copper chaperone